ncbi:LOW QUALITY PROTEIN: hypothetical protein U9M48_040707, partial [Paspalum notatum var. saurae]
MVGFAPRPGPAEPVGSLAAVQAIKGRLAACVLPPHRLPLERSAIPHCSSCSSVLPPPETSERRTCEDSRSVTYGPMVHRDMERIANLRVIYESDDTRCVDLLRMKKAPFFQLRDLFRTRSLLRDSIHSTVEEQVAMFLHVVGHNQRFRDCIGDIDGTHVPARVPGKMQPAFIGRKHTTTQNILAAVDFDLRFTYVLAGWEGSAHDALILADALERDDGLRVPPGKFYLVDAGYAVRPGFLSPYRATRYHLREFGSNRPWDQKELFNLSGMAEMGNDVHVDVVEVPEGPDAALPQPANGGNGAMGGLSCAGLQSVLGLWFADLVGQGVKTDKGFKEVHVNAVARQLSEFIGQDVTGTQVYNHLCKWRQRWVKICKLRDLSGALWDEDNYMIVLDEEHLLGHTKDHPKDAEFLNTPIEHYVPKQTIFSSGQATGRFAIGSNEPLGTPIDFSQPHNDTKTKSITLDDVVNQKPDASKSVEGPKQSDEKVKVGSASGSGSGSGSGKRKRISEEEGAFMIGMTNAVQNVADAMAPMPPGLYNAVMLTPGFEEEALMFALQNLLDNKALGRCFLEMTDPHR